MKSGSLKYVKRLEFTFVPFNLNEILDKIDFFSKKQR